MRWHLAVALLAMTAALPAQQRPAGVPAVTVRVDSSRHEIVVSAGPFQIPTMPPGMEMHHGHDMMDEMSHTRIVRFDWPVDGYLRGFRVELRDSTGAPLPKHFLHHLIAVNFDRRQPVYPAAERLFGAGSETEDVSLPPELGVPLKRGERLGYYAAWHNESGKDIDGVTLRVILPWTPANTRNKPVAVFPIYMDVNNHIGGTNAFDLPPGRSSKSFEFSIPVTGRLIAVGGHLHDYGTTVRLEDAESGKVLARLKAKRDSVGHVLAVSRKVFWLFPKKLRAGHRYRVTGEYDNPTGQVIAMGAMAHMVGLFAPDRLADWPAIDPNDPEFRKDVATLPLSTADVEAGGDVTGDAPVQHMDGSDHEHMHMPPHDAPSPHAQSDSTRHTSPPRR